MTIIKSFTFYFLLIGLSLNTQAAVIIDQSYTMYGGATQYNPVAQTFTVGTAGTLVGMEINVTSSISYPDAEFVFQVVETINGIPDDNPGSVLATIGGVGSDLSNTLTTTPPYHYFDLSTFNISVNVNDVLAFIWDTATTPIQINGRMSNSTYDRGSAYIYSSDVWTEYLPFGSPTDLSFQTYVTTVPEPPSLSLMLCAILGLFVFKRREQMRI